MCHLFSVRCRCRFIVIFSFRYRWRFTVLWFWLVKCSQYYQHQLYKALLVQNPNTQYTGIGPNMSLFTGKSHQKLFGELKSHFQISSSFSYIFTHGSRGSNISGIAELSVFSFGYKLKSIIIYWTHLFFVKIIFLEPIGWDISNKIYVECEIMEIFFFKFCMLSYLWSLWNFMSFKKEKFPSPEKFVEGTVIGCWQFAKLTY